jgi:integrase
VAALEDPDTVRAALNACARRLDGRPAAATTTRRKRAVFANALGYAVERRLLPANPLGQIQWKASEVTETVDRRSVANPAQARRLLKAVRRQGPRGEHMEAFFGSLYYAALRPAEAVALREADCVLPRRGWGRIDLAASWPCAGTGWTDDGASREERGLKHRAAGETRSIPIPPVLVTMLRGHIARYGTSPGGRLFRTALGGPLNDTGWGEVWQRARPLALTPPSRHHRWPAAPTTSGTPPCRYGLTPAFPPPKSRAAPATTSPSCSRSTPTASTARPAPPTSASAMPSANPSVSDSSSDGCRSAGRLPPG